jgi:hypothetical protein
VRAGGRLVADLQFAFCDDYGRLLPHGPDSELAQLFGAWVETIHDGRTGGPSWQGEQLDGSWADIAVQDADIIAAFGDGRPAITRTKLGQGESLLLAMDPSSAAAGRGTAWAEDLLSGLLRSTPSSWASSLSQTICPPATAADHYFFINPGPATTAWVQSSTPYRACECVLEGSPAQLSAAGFSVSVPARSAQWVRAVKGAS